MKSSKVLASALIAGTLLTTSVFADATPVTSTTPTTPVKIAKTVKVESKTVAPVKVHKNTSKRVRKAHKKVVKTTTKTIVAPKTK